MYYRLAPDARLYRLTGPNVAWPTPVLGQGAYFTHGGRFNRAGQATVYCSEDPVVVITEMAFYQALEWQHRISVQRFNPMTYPLVSTHLLWSFGLNPAPAIIDLESQATRHTFGYPAHLLLNPALNPRKGAQSATQPPGRDYTGTQALADEIRAYEPPFGAGDRAEGLKAPSVRSRPRHGFQPHQLALFVKDPKIQRPYEERAMLVDQWDLHLEFQAPRPRGGVDYHTPHIDWVKPRFRLEGTKAIPAFTARPGAKELKARTWYRIEIAYA